MSHVDRYYAKKTPYYSRVHTRGQVTIPKPLRNYWEFDKSQFVKMTTTDTGVLMEPVVGVIPKGQQKLESGGETKDPELAEAERADLDDIYNRIMR